MTRAITLLLLVLSFAADACGQYLWTNPGCNCAMCNRRRAYNAQVRQQLQPQVMPVQYVQPVPEQLARSSAADVAWDSAADVAGTPYEALLYILPLLQLSPSETLVDVGCGDARVLITACRIYGCQGIGYEIDPVMAQRAQQAIRDAGLLDCITIVHGDAIQCAVVDGRTVYAYMWPAVLAKLPLGGAKRVVSYSHSVPGLSMTEVPFRAGGNVHKAFVR